MSILHSILASVGYKPYLSVETNKVKKRKQTLNVDKPDVEWFSTPPLCDEDLAVEGGTSGTQAAAGGPNPTNSSEPLPTPPADAEMDIDIFAGPSTSATGFVRPTGSRKPLTTGEGRGAATYAYRTAPSHERSSPLDPTSIPEISTVAHSAIPPVPVPSTAGQQLSGLSAALPSGGPSEALNNCRATSEGPPSGKQKSNKKKKGEKENSRDAASSAATMPSATASTPTTPSALTTVEDKAMRTEHAMVSQLRGQQAGPNEDVDNTGEILNTEPISDDPLNMRAGLIVNGVLFFQ